MDKKKVKERREPFTKSLIHGLDVLEYIASHSGLVGVTEISKKVGLDKSTTYRLMTTLEHKGYLMQDSASKKYRLSFKILELFNMALGQLELWRVSYPILEKLVKEVNETAHLAILDKGEVFYLHTCECTHLMRITSCVGKRNPAHCTALGKALLAFLPEEEVEEIFREVGMEWHTDNTITDINRLKEELKIVREQGFAMDNEELHKGIRCVAAPIRDHSRKVVAAISISGPRSRLSSNKMRELGKVILPFANEISCNLGYKESLESSYVRER